uniref:piggyBac transposable element-derived protein 4-like n=1 Tax=Myxine glutinosa TaxID=7769 RepID=UPI00358E440B
MADCETENERIRKLLDELDVESDPEDDSDCELDFVEEDEHIADSDCNDSETDDLPQEPQRKRATRGGWQGKNKKTWWESKVPSAFVRARPHNVFRGRQGPKGPALNAQTPTDFWSLFITPEMVDLLVSKTNEIISDKRPNYAQTTKAKDTDSVEMKAFLGLLLLPGLYHSNRMNLDDLWNDDGTGVEIFRLVMTLHRFRFLLCCTRFDSKGTRPERRIVDKLAPIRDLFEMFVTNCLKNYSPSEFVTIDEMLVAFRGKCPFRQYIPSKPAKYGIKIQAMADAKNYYVCKIEIYAGKQPDVPFKVDNSAIAVVSRLTSEISGSGRNVTFDNWYTTFPLVRMLLDDHKLSVVATLRKNKPEIPKEFLETKNRCNYDSMFGFTDKMTLVSYIPQSKKKKNVLLVSSMHYDDKIDPNSGDKNKPEIITFYNATKGGVDMVDQMAAMYDTSGNSRRWPMTVFYTLLNISNLNSYILYCHTTQEKINRRSFIATCR